MSHIPPSSDPSAAADQERWFAQELQAHEPLLKAYLRGAYPKIGDVEDVVQESYLRILRARARQPIASAKAFLFQVARRLALDLTRRRNAAPIIDVTDLAALRVFDGEPDAADATCTREEIELLTRAIHSLPARCREIVVLRKLKCVPQKEIARRLGISEQTVQVQVCRGVKRVADYLRRHGAEGNFHDDGGE